MIGLMDCNNFFVSCERLFRPDLRNRPVAVLSSNDGCIVARSQEVKDLGISMGVPYFQVQDICKKHDIVLFSSNFQLYRDISKRVMRALSDEFDNCEVYSVDEAFFGINEDSALGLEEIRRRIIQKTGIPVSIGIAPTKTLAKVANNIAKRGNVRLTKSHISEGVCVLEMGEWRKMAEDVSCGSIWGIGRQTSAVLTQNGINTISEFLACDRSYVRRLLGVVGERVHMELQGVSVYALGELSGVEQESYTSTRSFHSTIQDKGVLMSALAYHVSEVAEKLRKDGCVGSRLTIIAKGSRFGDFSHRDGTMSTPLIIPTNDTFVLMKEARHLLDALYDATVPYKKAGVVIGGIEPQTMAESSLFTEDTRTQSLSFLEDEINKKFGKGVLRHGATLGERKWQERKELKSPNYTTSWQEMAVVKAQ